METFLFTTAVFGIALLLLGIRLLLDKEAEFAGTCSTSSNRKLKDDHGITCGGCAQKEVELCPSEDEQGLASIAQLGNPIRQRDLKGFF